MLWQSSRSSAPETPACLQGWLAGNRGGGSGGRWCPRQCAPNAPTAAAGVTVAAAAATLPPLPTHPCSIHPSLTRPSARSPGGAAAAGHGAGAACGAAARGSRGGLCGLRAPLPGVPWRPVQVRVVCSFGCKPGRRLLIFPCCRHICPCTFMQQSFRSGCLSLLNMKHCAPVSLHLFRYLKWRRHCLSQCLHAPPSIPWRRYQVNALLPPTLFACTSRTGKERDRTRNLPQPCAGTKSTRCRPRSAAGSSAATFTRWLPGCTRKVRGRTGHLA